MFLVKLTWHDPEACERKWGKRVKWRKERRMERFPVLDTTVSRSDSDQALLEHRCTGTFSSRLPFCVLPPPTHTHHHRHRLWHLSDATVRLPPRSEQLPVWHALKTQTAGITSWSLGESSSLHCRKDAEILFWIHFALPQCWDLRGVAGGRHSLSTFRPRTESVGHKMSEEVQKRARPWREPHRSRSATKANLSAQTSL